MMSLAVIAAAVNLRRNKPIVALLDHLARSRPNARPAPFLIAIAAVQRP